MKITHKEHASLADGKLEKTIAIEFHPEDEEDKAILAANGNKHVYYLSRGGCNGF
jgi:hypothetical protein